MSEPGFDVRRLTATDLRSFADGMPAWNSYEYERRLAHQARGLAVQLVAWSGDVAVGKGMVVLPGHPEWSPSAFREGVPELRDVEVLEAWRGRGIGTAIVRRCALEAGEAGFDRVGLMVGLDETFGAARRVYQRLGFRQVHGPFISGALLQTDDGRGLPVAGVCVYMVRDVERQPVS